VPLFNFNAILYLGVIFQEFSFKDLSSSSVRSLLIRAQTRHPNHHKAEYVNQTQHGISACVKTNISKLHIREAFQGMSQIPLFGIAYRSQPSKKK
jgi:hypothetical protein